MIPLWLAPLASNLVDGDRKSSKSHHVTQYLESIVFNHLFELAAGTISGSRCDGVLCEVGGGGGAGVAAVAPWVR